MVKVALEDHKSIMEEAFTFCTIMTTEAKIDLTNYLTHVALTLRFDRETKEIKLKFVKVWSPNVHGNKFIPDISLKFKETQQRLLQVMVASWDDKVTIQGNINKNKKPDRPHYLTSIREFAKKGTNLVELLLASVVIVSYSLPLKNPDEDILPTVRCIFEKAKSFASSWKILDNLLRVKVSNDNKTLEYIMMNPSKASTVLEECGHTHDPEKVRDWAVNKIHATRKRGGDLYYSGSVQEKDAAIWAYRILQRIYAQPDAKVNGVFTFLYLKAPTKSEVGSQQERHNRLSAQYACNVNKKSKLTRQQSKDKKSDDSNGDCDSTNSEDNDKEVALKQTTINFDSDAEEEQQENLIEHGSIPILQEADSNDKNNHEIDNTLPRNVDNTNCGQDKSPVHLPVQDDFLGNSTTIECRQEHSIEHASIPILQEADTNDNNNHDVDNPPPQNVDNTNCGQDKGPVHLLVQDGLLGNGTTIEGPQEPSIEHGSISNFPESDSNDKNNHDIDDSHLNTVSNTNSGRDNHSAQALVNDDLLENGIAIVDAQEHSIQDDTMPYIATPEGVNRIVPQTQNEINAVVEKAFHEQCDKIKTMVKDFDFILKIDEEQMKETRNEVTLLKPFVDNYYTIIDVLGDGHCGYYATIIGLMILEKDMNLRDENISKRKKTKKTKKGTFSGFQLMK
jgi:hypothetical protein